MLKNTFIILFFLLVCLIFLFSYSQVDLNLTLSANPLYLDLQKILTQIGYFNRPLSTVIWSVLIVLLFSFYFWILKKSKQEKVNLKFIKIIIGISLLLLLAYPAFSYDLFNYMFDARIVTQYQLSPYHFKALDFPNDTWTRFMHWTHRYYPYGPLWLWLTLPASFLGMGKFVVTLMLFKLTFGIFHVANCWLIHKIAGKLKLEQTAVVIFYALNPLILVESLLSPHNEVILLTFTLSGIYFLLRQKIGWAVLAIFLGAAVKYINIFMLPLLIFWEKRLDTKFIETTSWLWLVFLIPLILFREFYGWYLIPLVGLVALTPKNIWLNLIAVGLSAGLLFRYLPFLYFGDYARTTSIWQTGLFTGVFLVIVLIWQRGVWIKKSN